MTNCSSISSKNDKLPCEVGQSKAKTDPKRTALHPCTSSTSISNCPSSCEISHLNVRIGERGKLTCIIK